ncbi:MAG TPA: hypothetical protein VHA54_02920 [Solirubrobacterales bacterium]|nr:hypothetical protein [Solirubrobacterales bacterium]
MRARVLVVTVALALLGTSSARADYDPVGSGRTLIVLDKGFLSLLKRNGVKLRAAAPATLRGSVLTLPATGGRFDPTSLRGTVEHEGALVLAKGARSIPIKAFHLKTTQKHQPFSVKVGGGQLKLGVAARLTVKRLGFGDEVAVSELAISQKVATRLAKKLHLKGVLAAGTPFGSSRTEALPQMVTVLDQGRVSLAFDPGFEAKLKSLFVAVNPIFPGERPGPFTLAIFGGKLAPDAAAGTMQTEGGIEFLQLAGGQAFWSELWLEADGRALSAEVDAEPSPPYAGKVGRTQIGTLSLGPATADAQARTITAAGSLTLSPALAASFNDLFAKPQGRDGVFSAGETVGTVGFTAQVQ